MNSEFCLSEMKIRCNQQHRVQRTLTNQWAAAAAFAVL